MAAVGLGLWATLGGVAAGADGIRGVLHADPESPSPVGVPITFSMEDLEFELSLPVGEWWTGDTSPWSYQWKIDDGYWGGPDLPVYTPGAEWLGDTGSHTMSCRVTFHYAVSWDEGGVEHTGGPVTASAEFTREFVLVGLDALEYSLDPDPGREYQAAGYDLFVGPGVTVYFRVTPVGAEAFPTAQPVWTVGGTAAGTGATFASAFESESLVTVTCGTASACVLVRPACVSGLEWKITGTDDFFQPVPAAPTPLFVARGTGITFRAVTDPPGAPWPESGAVWTGATPVSATPWLAAATFGTVSASLTAGTTVSAGWYPDDPGASVTVVTVGIAGLRVGYAPTEHGERLERSVSGAGMAESVPVGMAVDLSCVYAPSGATCPWPVPEWYVRPAADPQYGTTAVTVFHTPAASATAAETVTVTCGADTWDLDLLACSVEKLRYRLDPLDAFQDAPANLIINRLSDTPEFQAVITPAGAAWPAGCPVWYCSSAYGMVATGDQATVDPYQIGGSGGVNAWLVLMASCGLDQSRCWVNVLDEMTSAPLLPSAPSCVAHGGTVDISAHWRNYYQPGWLPLLRDWSVGPADHAGFSGGYTNTASVTVVGDEPSDQRGDVLINTAYPGDPFDGTPDLRLSVVSLAGLEYVNAAGAYASVPTEGPLYVEKGVTLQFRAVPQPGDLPDNEWPPGYPQWGLPGRGQTEGGPVQAVTFDTVGTYTVMATCDNEISVQVTVCDLVSLTVADARTGGGAVTDSTPADEPAGAANVLYVVQDADGQVTLDLTAAWAPQGLAGDKVCWRLEDIQGNPATGWSQTSGDFSHGASLTWQAPADGARANREFRLCTTFGDEVRAQGDSSRIEQAVHVVALLLDVVVGGLSESVEEDPGAVIPVGTRATVSFRVLPTPEVGSMVLSLSQLYSPCADLLLWGGGASGQAFSGGTWSMASAADRSAFATTQAAMECNCGGPAIWRLDLTYVGAGCSAAAGDCALLAAVEVIIGVSQDTKRICARTGWPSERGSPLKWDDHSRPVKVSTVPPGFGTKVTLVPDSAIPSDSCGPGAIAFNGAGYEYQYTYTAMEEPRDDLWPGKDDPDERFWKVRIKDTWSGTTKDIDVFSVFRYLVNGGQSTPALEYVKWKYTGLIGDWVVGTYGGKLDGNYGQTNPGNHTVQYGDAAFRSENALVSTIAHEAVHARQDSLLVLGPGGLSRGCYERHVTDKDAGYPEPPENPTGTGTVGKGWGIMEFPAYKQEADLAQETGIIDDTSYYNGLDSNGKVVGGVLPYMVFHHHLQKFCSLP